MSNPTKIYNDYVRANLPSTMTFDSTTDRYDINNHSFFSFKEANWYFKYVTKFGYTSLSVYAVNNFDPDLVFDFEQSYYRTGGTDSTLSSSVTHARASSATMTNSSGNIVTVGNNVARVGHHIYNGSTWVNEGVLHESEARTNRATNSNLFSSNNYTKNNISVTASSVTSPDGSNNGWKITPTGTNPYIRRGGSISGNFTHSLYVKKDTADYVVLGHGAGTKGLLINFSFASGTVVDTGAYGSSTTYISNTVENVDNGWYRISVTGNTGANNNLVTFPWDSATAPTNLDSSSNASSSTVYIYGAQTEVASTPSSYIPTTGSTVTRAAETLTVPAANLPYSSTNMSIQMDGKMTYADTGAFGTVRLFDWTLDSNNGIIANITTEGSLDGQIYFTQEEAGVVDSVNSDAFNIGINVPFNIASRHGSGFINGSISGTALTANTTPSALPNLSSTNLKIGFNLMGTISKFRMWDEDLTDTGIEEAST